MNKAVINIKTDPKLKREAQKVAKAMGLSLSSLINAQLIALTRERSVTFRAPEIPSPYLEKLLEESSKDIEAGYISPSFNNADDAIAWLKDPHAKYQNNL